MKRSKQRGITLIALVITIIVLLILAAVSIATLTGENGILTRANDSRTKTEIGEEKEAIGLAYNGVMTDSLGTGVEAGALQNELRSNGYTNATAVDNGDGTITVTFESGRSYTIDSNGEISDPEESNIMATMKIVGEKVTEEEVLDNIPEGFHHVEGTTLNDGLVISDAEGDDLNNTAGGNQFVWVPVDRNQRIEIDVTSKKGNIESITLTNPFGDIIFTTSDIGATSYNNIGNGIDPVIQVEETGMKRYMNGIYTLIVVAGGETKETKLDVYSLYGERIWVLDQFTDKVAKELGYENAEDYYNNTEYNQSGMSLDDMKNMMSLEYKSFYETEDYIESVNNNGGFYIGRFEVSEESGKIASKKNKTPWGNILQTTALQNAKNMYSSNDFISTLLTGAAWDRTCCWLYETGEKSVTELIGDSTSWGNYLNDEDGDNGLINTGSTERTVANNIYDLAGNLEEWSTEATGTYYRFIKGR